MEQQEPRKLTVKVGLEAYDKTGFKPVAGALVGTKADEEDVGGVCGCLVGVLYAAEKGWTADQIDQDKKLRISSNSEWFVVHTYNVATPWVESGFDYGYAQVMAAANGVEADFYRPPNNPPSRDIYHEGWKVGVIMAARMLASGEKQIEVRETVDVEG